MQIFTNMEFFSVFLFKSLDKFKFGLNLFGISLHISSCFIIIILWNYFSSILHKRDGISGGYNDSIHTPVPCTIPKLYMRSCNGRLFLVGSEPKFHDKFQWGGVLFLVSFYQVNPWEVPFIEGCILCHEYSILCDSDYKIITLDLVPVSQSLMDSWSWLNFYDNELN